MQGKERRIRNGLRWCVFQTKPREEEIAVAHMHRQAFEVFPVVKEP